MSARELTSFIYHRDGRKCRYCERYLNRREATVDHWLPRALGGGDEHENLRLSCFPCNSDKADMHPDAWEQILAHRRAVAASRPVSRRLSKLELLARCAPLWRERKC